MVFWSTEGNKNCEHSENLYFNYFLLRLFSYHSHVIGLPVPLVKAVKIPKPWHFDKRKGSTERLFRTQYIPLK
jgi:hypothetical protein